MMIPSVEYGTDICTNTDTKILAFEFLITLAAAPLESRDSVLEEKEQKYSLKPFEVFLKKIIQSVYQF